MRGDSKAAIADLAEVEERLFGATVGGWEMSLLHEMVGEESGLDHAATTRRRLAGVVKKRMVALGILDLASYYKFAKGRRDEIFTLSEMAQVHETYFFRHPRVWDELKRTVLIGLVNAHPQRKLQIWSAGCSTGEEVYTLAIVCNEVLGIGKFDIVGTDISRQALDTARAGSYKDRSLQNVSQTRLQRFFAPVERADGQFAVRKEYREPISFYHHNLLSDPPPPPGRFDLIFARHVLMYMSADAADKVFGRLLQSLYQRGLLIVTPAEALLPPPEDLEVVSIPGAIGYRPFWDLGVSPAWPKPRRGPVPPSVPPGKEPDRLLVDDKKPEKVKSVIRQPLTRESKREVVAHAGRVHKLVKKGFSAADSGDTDKAMALAVEALDIEPLSGEGHFLVGVLAESGGDAEHALKSFRRALFCDPELAPSHLHLGMAHEALGDLEGAGKSFIKAARELPKNPQAWQRVSGSVQVADLLSVCRFKLEQLGAKR